MAAEQVSTPTILNNRFVLIDETRQGGMGSIQKSYDISSQSNVAIIKAHFTAVDFGDDVSVAKLLDEISRGLRQQMLMTPELLGMGTTIVIAIVTAETLTFVNVGDSRCYLNDEGGLRQITHDDVPSRPSRLRRTGAITQALGGVSARTPVTPHIHRTGCPEGGWCLILCSDGVSDFLPREEIARVGRSGSADALTLVNSSLQAGGEDNISAIIVRSSAPSPDR